MSLAHWTVRMPRHRSNKGFSLLEMLIVIGITATLIGIAVPNMLQAIRFYRINSASRQVAAQIRTARLAAVTTNRTMIVRFNCPAARQYRFVEFTGDPVIDNAANRCAAPYPDPDPVALPNNDGPPRWLPDTMNFGAVQDLRISTTGLVTPLAGGVPAVIQVTNGALTRQITVSAAGRVQSQ